MITYSLIHCYNIYIFFIPVIYFSTVYFFTVEKGSLAVDYSSGVGSNTLVFTSGECNRLFEINGSRLLLKEDLLDESVCVSFFQPSFNFVLKSMSITTSIDTYRKKV